MKEQEILSNFITELNRGTLTLCVLSQLATAKYGYSLLQILSDKQIQLEANTLYPMLRRLESQGVLESNWDTSESRPRKFYRLSTQGARIYASLKKNYEVQQRLIHTLLEETQNA